METQIVLLNSSTFVDRIMKDLEATGPVKARYTQVAFGLHIRWGKLLNLRWINKSKRLTVLYVIKYWSNLIASPGEETWARKKIEEHVISSSVWWQIFLLKILVGLIINWFLKRRNADFDAAMRDVIDNL